MFTVSLPWPNKNAYNTAQAIIHAMQALPPEARKTLTLDNGAEFAKHAQVCKDLGLKTFFCDPYASWQKGGVENTNGRLRRDLPRNTNIRTMNQEDFQENIDNYNQTLKTKTSNGFRHFRFSTKIYNVSHFKLECGFPSTFGYVPLPLVWERDGIVAPLCVAAFVSSIRSAAAPQPSN